MCIRDRASGLRLKTPRAVGAAAGETPSLMGEVIGETHRGLECAQAHFTREPAPEGPSLIVGSGVKD